MQMVKLKIYDDIIFFLILDAHLRDNLNIFNVIVKIKWCLSTWRQQNSHLLSVMYSRIKQKYMSFDLPHLLWDSPSSKPQYGWLLINYITISFSFTVTVAVHVSPSRSTVYTMEIDSWSRINILHCSTYTCNTTVSSLYSRLPVLHLHRPLCAWAFVTIEY